MPLFELVLCVYMMSNTEPRAACSHPWDYSQPNVVQQWILIIVDLTFQAVTPLDKLTPFPSVLCLLPAIHQSSTGFFVVKIRHFHPRVISS